MCVVAELKKEKENFKNDMCASPHHLNPSQISAAERPEGVSFFTLLLA